MTKEDAEVLKVLCLVRCPVDLQDLGAALGRGMSTGAARLTQALSRLEGEEMVRASSPEQGPVVFSASPIGYASWIAMAQAPSPL